MDPSSLELSIILDVTTTSVTNLLNEASSSGALDSEGSFTIAESQALAKLASFQLPRKPAWILKIIQAAVALESDAITVKQGVKDTSFHFATAHTIDLQTVKRALMDPKLQKTGYLNHLVLGLRAVGFGDQRNFQLKAANSQVEETLTWDQQDLCWTTAPAPKGSPQIGVTLKLKVGFPPTVVGRSKWTGALTTERAAGEYLEAVRYAQACPVPLKFDGHRLDILWARGSQSENSTCLNFGVGYQSPDHDNPHLNLRPPETLVPSKKLSEMSAGEPFFQSKTVDDFLNDPNHPENRIFLGKDKLVQGQCSSFMRLAYTCTADYGLHKPTSSFVHWLIDGVIIESQKLGKPINAVSFDVYLSGEDLPTDISGLTFREQAQPLKQQRLKPILPTVPALANRVRQELERHEKEILAKPRSKRFLAHKKELLAYGTALLGGLGLAFWSFDASASICTGVLSVFGYSHLGQGNPKLTPAEAKLIELIPLVKKFEEHCKDWNIDAVLASISTPSSKPLSQRKRTSYTEKSSLLASEILNAKHKP